MITILPNSIEKNYTLFFHQKEYVLSYNDLLLLRNKLFSVDLKMLLTSKRVFCNEIISIRNKKNFIILDIKDLLIFRNLMVDIFEKKDSMVLC